MPEPAHCLPSSIKPWARERHAVAITDTELKVVDALAVIGLSSRRPNAGNSTSAIATPSHVVNEREEEVLADVPHRRSAQAAGMHDAAEVTLHQRDSGAPLERDIRTGTHLDPHVCLRGRGGVADAVNPAIARAPALVQVPHDWARLKRMADTTAANQMRDIEEMKRTQQRVSWDPPPNSASGNFSRPVGNSRRPPSPHLRTP